MALSLVAATPANRARTIKWLNGDRPAVIARGPTTPRRAIDLGLRYRPEVMFLLSDNITGHGRYAIDGDELVSTIESLKSKYRAKTSIHTIQYLYEDPTQTLERIAKANGGNHGFIDPSYVGLR